MARRSHPSPTLDERSVLSRRNMCSLPFLSKEVPPPGWFRVLFTGLISPPPPRHCSFLRSIFAALATASAWLGMQVSNRISQSTKVYSGLQSGVLSEPFDVGNLTTATIATLNEGDFHSGSVAWTIQRSRHLFFGPKYGLSITH